MATFVRTKVYAMVKNAAGEVNKEVIAEGIWIAVLKDGFRIWRNFYEFMQKRVEKRLPKLERGKSYTSRMLAGTTFNSVRMDRVQRITVGRCVSDMVQDKRLPLICVTPPNRTPKKYRLK